jgi:hypothetical protein
MDDPYQALSNGYSDIEMGDPYNCVYLCAPSIN